MRALAKTPQPAMPKPAWAFTSRPTVARLGARLGGNSSFTNRAIRTIAVDQ
jgi:hypothetical protein